MTVALIIAGALVSALFVVLVERWSTRRNLLTGAETQDDPRQADAMRWPGPRAD